MADAGFIKLVPPGNDLCLDRFATFLRMVARDGINTVDLSGQEWTHAKIAVLMYPFLKMTGVTTLKLTDILGLGITESDTSLILEALAFGFQGAPLKQLEISCNQLGVAVRNLSPLLSCSTLVCLEMKKCALGHDAMEIVRQSLAHGGASLQALVLDGNCIGENGAVHVAGILEKLVRFSYAGCRPGQEGTAIIMDELLRLGNKGCLRDLRELVMDDSCFSTESLQSLSTILQPEKTPSISKLCLRDTGNLSGQFMKNLATAWSRKLNLLELDLGYNELGEDDISPLKDIAFQTRRSLKIFRLDNNQLGGTGILGLLQGLQGRPSDFDHINNVLEHLALDDNDSVEGENKRTLKCQSEKILKCLSQSKFFGIQTLTISLPTPYGECRNKTIKALIEKVYSHFETVLGAAGKVTITVGNEEDTRVDLLANMLANAEI